MGVTIASEIKVLGIDGVHYVKEFEMHNIPSKHPTARVVMELDSHVDVQKKISEKQLIRIVKGNEKKIFVGFIGSISVIRKSGYYQEAVMTLTAKSMLVDGKRKKRSFQDTQMTYEDIMKKVLEEYPDIFLKGQTMEKKPIGSPIIQYEETDWEFLLRLASAYQEPLLVDETGELTTIFMGKRDLIGEFICYAMNYVSGISCKYYQNHGDDKSKYIYYRVTSQEQYPVGSMVAYKSDNYIICQKDAKLVNEELIYEYVLAGKEYLKVPQIFNKRFVGCTILGDIVKTKGETMELKLHLKDEGECSKYYAYPWKPEAGNLFYCMPKVGSIVSLYFPGEDERDAIAVNCIRREPLENQGNFDINKKYFETEDNKSLVMADDGMHFFTETVDATIINQITLLDMVSLWIKTAKGMKINCNGLLLYSPVVAIASGTYQGIYAGNQQHTSMELANGVFNILADDKLYLLMNGFYQDNPFPLIDDEPEKGKGGFSFGMLANIVIGIVAVGVIAAACVFALPAVLGLIGVATGTAAAIGAGAAVGAVVTGTFAIGSQASEDYHRGEGENVIDALIETSLKTIGGAIEGGICALAGPMKWGGKLLVNLGGNAVNATFDFWADNDKSANDRNKLGDFGFELLESSILNLLTTGAFDIFPDSKLCKTLSDKVKNSEIAKKIMDNKLVGGAVTKAKSAGEYVENKVKDSKLVKWWKDRVDNEVKVDLDALNKQLQNYENALEGVETGIRRKKNRNKGGRNNGSIARLKEQKEKLINSINATKGEIGEKKNILENDITFFTYMENKYDALRQAAKANGEKFDERQVWLYRAKEVMSQLPSAYVDKVKKDATGAGAKKIGKEVKKIAVHVVGGNGN